MTLAFAGDVVLVTGAGSGLGAVHARGLAARGAHVFVNDRPGAAAEHAQDLVAELCASGLAASLAVADVSDSGAVDDMVGRVVAAAGRIDALVNNAGVLLDADLPDLSIGDWRRSLAVNLDACFYLTKACWPHFVDGGGGRIVNTGSASGLFGNTGQVNYSTAKMGLAGLTRAAAVEGEALQIRANLLAPMAATPMSSAPEVGATRPSSRIPARTLFGPEIFDDFAPQDVTTLVAVLVHGSCPVTGRYFTTMGGHVREVRIVEGSPFGGPGASDEDVRSHVEVSAHRRDPGHHASMADHVRYAATQVRWRDPRPDSDRA